MRAKILMWLLATFFLATFSAAEAQQQAKVAKIGGLVSGGGLASGREILRRELHALGYVEGKNITFEYRYSEGKIDRFPALADGLVRLKVDVLVASSTSAALAAKMLPGRSRSFF